MCKAELVKELDEVNIDLWQADEHVSKARRDLVGKGTLTAYRRALIKYEEIKLKSLKLYELLINNN